MAQGIMTLAGYILGFPADTPESIRRDIAVIKKELPIDILEFFCLTPLPGSEDHQVLWKQGVPMDPDLNGYDVEHVCAPHANMTKQEWEAVYQEAWSQYYAPEHMVTLLRRAAATGVPLGSLLKVLLTFATSVPIENVHPLQSGILRLRHPSERRPGLAPENRLTFWPRFAWETLAKHAKLVSMAAHLLRAKIAIARDPNALAYTDLALAPVEDDEDERLDLLTKTAGAHTAVAHAKRMAELTAG
jgi:hypothetical protein